MSTVTTNLSLFKYTETDYDEAFNYEIALNENWDILDNQVDSKNIISLGNSGTLVLTKNRVHKCTATSSITFSLPIGSTDEFRQILVLFYMSSVYTITLGTTYYFNGTTPTMTDAGYYTIIYEYDSIRSGWVVGAIKKASA